MSGRVRDNNYVSVRHDDGTVASYVHLQHGGAPVEVGQLVAQRDVIGLSGNTGRSMIPDLHFQVSRGRRPIPVAFRDVARHRGVPRSLRFYQAAEPD